MTWGEIDRLRQLVPVQVDRHLANWSHWARRYRVEVGCRDRSTGFSGTGASSFEDLENEADAWAAELADSLISEMAIHHRNAIAAVYAGGVWHLRPDLLGPTLIEAASSFWYRAQRKGLV